jgi:hypothetical protein
MANFLRDLLYFCWLRGRDTSLDDSALSHSRVTSSGATMGIATFSFGPCRAALRSGDHDKPTPAVHHTVRIVFADVSEPLAGS